MAILDPGILTSPSNLRAVVEGGWQTAVVVAVACLVTLRLGKEIYAQWRLMNSPLAKVPGPPDNPSLLFGHQFVQADCPNNEVQRRWMEEYGGTFATRAVFGRWQLVTMDLRAVTHILFNAGAFPKSSLARKFIRRLLGDSILWTEGIQHRNQRRLLDPAFSAVHMKIMVEIFLAKAIKLRDHWKAICDRSEGPARINSTEWLSKTTLDIIGSAGFGYEFNSIDGGEDELSTAFENMLAKPVSARTQLIMFIGVKIPFIRWLFARDRARVEREASQVWRKVGRRLIEQKKADIRAEFLLDANGKLRTHSVIGKDLISLLLQANMAADVDPAQRMTDDEVLDQIPTFLFAGHETTATTTGWALYSLSLNPSAQTKLREELTSIGTETPTLEELNALPYLNNVVRETLRLHPVVINLNRATDKDTVIPLSTPIVGRNGEIMTQIEIAKDDLVIIPIQLINRSKEIWGEDASEFRPERWDNIPKEASDIPCIQPHLMTFIAGARSCIGHRFAVTELKALLFQLFRHFEFKLGVPEDELWSRTNGIMRVQLKRDNQIALPLLVTAVN